jgi:hypothetical protein
LFGLLRHLFSGFPLGNHFAPMSLAHS